MWKSRIWHFSPNLSVRNVSVIFVLCFFSSCEKNWNTKRAPKEDKKRFIEMTTCTYQLKNFGKLGLNPKLVMFIVIFSSCSVVDYTCELMSDFFSFPILERTQCEFLLRGVRGCTRIISSGDNKFYPVVWPSLKCQREVIIHEVINACVSFCFKLIVPVTGGIRWYVPNTYMLSMGIHSSLSYILFLYIFFSIFHFFFFKLIWTCKKSDSAS